MAGLLTSAEFAGYRIDERIGRGGMGSVYRATDLKLDRVVALKVLSEELADDPVFRARFASESKLAASLDHPNVVPIYDAGEHDGMLYLAMRFVEGDDLRAVLRREGRLEPSRVASLVGQVAAALDAAHAKGLVHRDVKPANILLSRAGHVYLTDFGLSKRAGAGDHTRSGEILGTLDYIAPEQIRRDPVGPATDIYALGCMAFHLMTGRPPFPAESEEAKLWAHLSEPPPRATEVVDDAGSGTDRVLCRAMDKRPGSRYSSAGAMATALAAAVERGPARSYQSTRAPLRAPPGPAAPASVGSALRTAATDRFNIAVLVALLAIGVALGTFGLMVLLALVVYAAAIARSMLEIRRPRHG